MVDNNIEQLKAQLKAQVDQLTESKKAMEQAFTKVQSSLNNFPKEQDKKITNGFKAILMSDGKIIMEFTSSTEAADYFGKL